MQTTLWLLLIRFRTLLYGAVALLTGSYATSRTLVVVSLLPTLKHVGSAAPGGYITGGNFMTNVKHK